MTKPNTIANLTLINLCQLACEYGYFIVMYQCLVRSARCGCRAVGIRRLRLYGNHQTLICDTTLCVCVTDLRLHLNRITRTADRTCTEVLSDMLVRSCYLMIHRHRQTTVDTCGRAAGSRPGRPNRSGEDRSAYCTKIIIIICEI